MNPDLDEYNGQQIVGIKTLDVSGEIGICGEMENGDDIPLFPFDSSRINYSPAEFIGMSLQEVYERKRILDWIHYPDEILTVLREET